MYKYIQSKYMFVYLHLYAKYMYVYKYMNIGATPPLGHLYISIDYRCLGCLLPFVRTATF